MKAFFILKERVIYNCVSQKAGRLFRNWKDAVEAQLFYQSLRKLILDELERKIEHTL